ncbi:MAG: VTT domain-containing protein, partial [Candidatus Binatia bacterium]
VTMGVLRWRLLRKLREADRHGRCRIYYPVVPQIGEDFLKMHSKVLIVDDCFVRVGSSNLNNRSMGLDTECDLSLESAGDPAVEEAIRGFRNDLLGEHLGVPAERVEAETREAGSLASAVERLRGGPRTLVPLEVEISPWVDDMVPEAAIVDPERPIAPASLMNEILIQDEALARDVRGAAHRPLLRGALVLIIAGLLTALWRWGPLEGWVQPERIADLAEPLRESAAAPLLVLAGYVVAGLAVFPVTVLILATVLLFGPVLGFLYSMLGSVLSAAVTYWLGRLLGGCMVNSLGGSRLSRVAGRLARGGFAPVAAVRAVPVAPFTLVNLVAGAAHIPFRSYLLGTVVGMAPGMVALTLFGVQLSEAVREPGAGSLALLVAFGALLLAGSLWLRRRLREEPGGISEDRAHA